MNSNNKILFLTFVLISLSFTVQAVIVEDLPPELSPETCYPIYKCTEWGECVDGLQHRACIDDKCERREIVERRFCASSACESEPEVECLRWSSCIYTEKIDDLIRGKLGFGGYRSRICRDATGCLDPFMEETPCEEFFPISLGKIEECDEEFLVATDPVSQKIIAKIRVGSWEDSKKLDIIFTQGQSIFCPDCYNGELDPGEEGIDCGPDCEECKVASKFPITMAIIGAWLFSGFFIFLTVREIIYVREH